MACGCREASGQEYRHFEFSQFTPAGQDFFFSATMQGRSLESLVSDMEEYYEGFDADSEAYLWLDGNGHGKMAHLTE